MNSDCLIRTSAIVAQVGDGLPTGRAVDANLDRLVVADWSLWIIGAAIAAVAVVRWLRGGRRDPLALAPPRANTLRDDAVFLGVCAYLAGTVVTMLAVQVGGMEIDAFWPRVVVGSSGQIAGAVACLAMGRRFFEGGLPRFWVAESAMGVSGMILLTVGMTLAALSLCPLTLEATVSAVLWLVPTYEFADHPTISALQNGVPAGGVAALWGGAMILAPVAEELFFRGILQTTLVRVLHSRWRAVIGASLVFGLVHFPQPQAVPALVVLSLLMGFAYEKSGSLLPSMAIHVLFNFKTLAWESLSYQPPVP